MTDILTTMTNHKEERSNGHTDNRHDRAGDTEDDAFSMALDLFW